MKVKATDKLLTYRAGVLAERFGLDIKEIKTLKTGGQIDLEDDILEDMIAAGLIEAVTEGITVSPVTTDEEDL